MAGYTAMVVALLALAAHGARGECELTRGACRLFPELGCVRRVTPGDSPDCADVAASVEVCDASACPGTCAELRAYRVRVGHGGACVWRRARSMSDVTGELAGWRGERAADFEKTWHDH